MPPPSETEKYEGIPSMPRNWSSDSNSFQERMKLQSRMFEEHSLRNQDLIYASVADLKLGLVISHAELSGKVDSLTLGHNRVEKVLADHTNILSTIQSNIVDLRMDLLHGMPLEQPQQQQGINQSQQQSVINVPPGYSSPIAVPIQSQSSADLITQPIIDQEGIQTESSSIPMTECPSTTDTSTAATATTMTIPEAHTNPSLTSFPQHGMTNRANDQVKVSNHQSDSNGESSPSQQENGRRAETPEPLLPRASNSVPPASTLQSSQRNESETGDTIVDCVFIMDGCCGRELSVPVKYTEGRKRSLDLYECHFCKHSYKEGYYSQHIKNVCLPKHLCSLCGDRPKKPSKKRPRKHF